MTRETKVGLLVGMGVILLIGIIVSDHLSQAPPPAVLTDYAREAQESIAPAVPRASSPAYAEPQAMAQAQIPLQVPEAPVIPRIEPPPVMAHPPLVGAGRIEATFPPAPDRNQPGAWTPEPATEEFEWPDRNVTRDRVAVVKPPAPAGAPERPIVREEPQPIIHFVKDDETLWRLAERYYGSGSYWRAIVEANPGRIADNHRIYPGVRLVIPNKAGLAQHEDFEAVAGAGTRTVRPTQETISRAAAAPNAARPTSASDLSAQGGAAQASTGRTITVQPTDTLSSLARRHLGDEKRWKELYEANRAAIANPDRVVPGTILALPVPTNRDRGGAERAAPTTARSGTSANTPAPSRPAAPVRTYTVKRGDTLHSIAQRELGDAKRWEDIFEANKKVINDPDRIPLGQEIRLPSNGQS